MAGLEEHGVMRVAEDAFKPTKRSRSERRLKLPV